MLLTVREAAKELRVNKMKVYELIKSGELPHVQLGSMKVRREALEEYVKGLEQ